MCDTFNPLRLTTLARDLDDGKYALSWYESDETAVRRRPHLERPLTFAALRLDWDGTATVQDSLVQVIHEFGDPAILAELEPRVGVDLTLHEEIALEFEAVTSSLDEVVEWVLENVEVRPGLAELAELRPVIVSAGFHELIEPVLRA